MHYKEAKGILSSENNMNVFRGCTHGCIYCDSRSKCYQINHDFEDVEIKINAPFLLEEALKRKRKKIMVLTGSMTDPYLHYEKKLLITRRCLEVIEKYGFGVSIITKSNLILRDLDLIKKINQKAKAVVNITLTTYDDDLCKILEPNVATTKERFEVLKVMRDNNIPTVVWLDPILPFINDTLDNLMGILNYCIEAKVYGIICFGMALTLREGNREYFYKNLDQHFPGLKEKYIKTYGKSYEIVSSKNDELMKVFYDVCKKNNIITNLKELFKYRSSIDTIEVEQLTLF